MGDRMKFFLCSTDLVETVEDGKVYRCKLCGKEFAFDEHHEHVVIFEGEEGEEEALLIMN